MNRPGGKMDIENALPCPFCAQYPEIEPWHGGGPNKHMVSCANDRCHCGPGTTGNTKRQAIERWNIRGTASAGDRAAAIRDEARLFVDEKGRFCATINQADYEWLLATVRS